MLSELTTLALDAIDQLQIAGDKIYTRKVFFANKDGDGMSIQMMHLHNAEAAKHQICNTPDVVYLMYALITCQSWWEVSTPGHSIKLLRVGKSCIHVFVPTTCVCERVCVWVCVCVYTGMFPILDCTRKVVESRGISIDRAMFVVLQDWAVSSRPRSSGD